MSADLLNRGFIVHRQPTDGPRTLIVTGAQRSGTTMVAALLQQAGIFIGSEINDIVYEDEEIDRVLRSGDAAALRQLIAARDAMHSVWGFKLPMLCDDLPPERLAWFTNPHLIVTFRDPVAMAVRTAVSDYQDAMRSLHQVTADQQAMLAYVDMLACPSLLVSYEKALMAPGESIEALMRFCGIPMNDEGRVRLAAVVEPGRRRYVEGARRRYEGTIDCVLGGALHGWCRLTRSTDPVELEVFADDQLVTRVVADVFRQDLLDAGIGAGRHGFTIPLGGMMATPDAVIRIKVARHGVELGNSGKRLRDFAAGA